MEKIEYRNKKGVFFEETEFELLQNKILAQRQLIEDFEKEFGL